MIIGPSNLICPKCLKGGYVNYIGQSDKYIAKCYNCGFYFEKGTFLKEVSEKKTNNVTTNANRIRNMTDEELAEFIGRCVDHEFQFECVCFLNQLGCCQYPTRGCDENALEWLKQEAKI